MSCCPHCLDPSVTLCGGNDSSRKAKKGSDSGNTGEVNLPEILFPELMWDYPRPRRSVARGQTLHFPIERSLSEGLRTLGRRLNATPMAVGMSVFQTLLFRHTRVADATVGMTVSGRTQRSFADAIGYFVNTLPIRSQIDGKMSFAEVSAATAQTIVEARQAGDFPFALLVHRLQPVRDLNAPPLCRAVFGMQKPTAGDDVGSLLAGEGESIAWGDTIVAPYKLDQQEGQFDLVLELYDTPNGYSGVLKYDANLMRHDSAARFAKRFVHLLQQIVDDPTKTIDSYSIVPEDESTVIEQWSAGDPIEDPSHLRFDQWFESQVAANPQAHAATLGDQQWTYSQLDAHANRVARLLQQSGAQAGSHVIVATGRTIEAPILMLACFKIGAAYVPMSPQSPPARADQMIDDCKPAVIVAEASLIDRLRQRDSETKLIATSALLPLSESFEASSLQASFSESEIAYIICTSGSTGTPKGIAVSHGALCRHIRGISCVFGTTADDRMYQFSDLTFDPSIEQMVVTWSVGGAVVFRDDTLPSVEAFWQTMFDQRITIANLPPKYFEECSRALPIGEAWPKSLRLMIVGGDVFPRDVAVDWLQRGVRLLNAYGPTESVITATTFEVTDDFAGGKLPIGRPKPGSTAYVVDDQRRLLPIGVAGELVLGGPVLADGYINLPEATAEQFARGQIGGRCQRYYRTGDLARWNADGQLEFLGRIDRQVKIRGFRIELGDVEAALAACPGVTAGYGKAFHDAGDSYVGAFATVEAGSGLTVESITSELKGRLPIYMVPQRIMIIDDLPLLSSGKIDAAKLYAEPPSSTVKQRQYIPPRSEIEEVMTEVWAGVLGLQRVGIADDFYELGGGSLQSLRIVSELTQRGISLLDDQSGTLGPQMLFQYTTISELSPHLGRVGK
ncbi:MAG: amino acid adenylation domain-containing protein [Pirellulaceae bacterium]